MILESNDLVAARQRKADEKEKPRGQSVTVGDSVQIGRELVSAGFNLSKRLESSTNLPRLMLLTRLRVTIS